MASNLTPAAGAEHTPSSAFTRAVDEFLAKLEKKDDAKNPFLREVRARRAGGDGGSNKEGADVSAAKLRAFVERLETDGRGGRGRRLVARLEPFVNNLHGLLLACESLAQAAPFGVGVAFAGARVVLGLAAELGTYLETITDALVDVGDALRCYDQLADAFPSSTDIQDLLVRSYTRILRFWHDVSATLSVSRRGAAALVARGAVARSLDRDAKTALAGLRQDSTSVLALAQATAARQDRCRRDAARRAAVLDWIRAGTRVDPRPDLAHLLARRHPDTCAWLLDDDPRFRRWRDGPDSATLWYNAPPGSGKSVLAATVVDHLRSRRPPTAPPSDTETASTTTAVPTPTASATSPPKIAYYFYSFSDSARRDGISGLRSLALQLAAFVPVLPDRLLDLYRAEMDHHAVTLDDPDLAARVVCELASQCDRVYLIVDGLDECLREGPTALAFRRLLQMPTYGAAKWFLATRNHAPIRAAMDACAAVEVRPELADISRDICTYFSRYVACHGCVSRWTDGEDNFLYARIVCETLQGLGLTCEEDIETALRRFPKDLNGYYVRSLERLLERTEEEQELARRTFLILIAAAQSLSLSELLDALAIRPGARDHKSSRVPRVELVEELCSPLVVFEGMRLKLCHKTVHEFFLQDPDGVASENRDRLRRFFVAREAGDRELGLACLDYLQYERYRQPGLDLATVLRPSLSPPPDPPSSSSPSPSPSPSPTTVDHAFLRYAATFWAQHLGDVAPSADTDSRVRAFLQSPAFWTCTAVQARVVPYLFAVFEAQGAATYTLGIRAARSRHRRDDLSGVPLPSWLDALSAEGLLLDRSLCCFMQEWHEVLTTSPAGLHLCPPLRLFAANCHLAPPEKSRSVRIERLEESVPDLASASVTDVRLVDVDFVGKTLWADVLYREEGGTNKENSSGDEDVQLLTRLRLPLFSKRHPTSDTHKLPIQDDEAARENILLVGRRTGRPDSVESLRIDPQTLGVRRAARGHSEEHDVPVSFSQENIGRRRGAWEVASVQDVKPDTTRPGSTSILHATWRHYKPEAVADTSRTFEKEGESDDDESNDDDSNDDSDDESYDDESDASEDRSDDAETQAHETPESDCESDPDELVSDCLILVPRDGGRPEWHAWSGAPRLWSRVSCALHPTLPLVVLSHTASRLDLIDTLQHTQRKGHLPDQSDQEAPLASLRELHFSPCGTYLHCLSISFVPDKANTTAHVAVSTFYFNPEGGANDTALREHPASRCTYTFAEPLANIPPPLALAHWTDTDVTVALPPLTCDPKILRVALPQAGNDNRDSAAIQTLRDPIYFPTSTPRRKPRLRYRYDDGSSSYLYLALDTLIPAEAPGEPGLDEVHMCPTPDWTAFSVDDEQDRQAAEPARVGLPVVLRWKVDRVDGWQAWNAERDGRASDMERGPNLWKMLKGEFVEGDRAFSVPVRSGLDWTRKSVLSCNEGPPAI